MRITQARCGMVASQTKRRADIIALLKTMPLLEGIQASTLSLLARDAAMLRYKRDETVYQRGSVPTGLFFVLQGGIKLLALEPDGREKVIELFTESASLARLVFFGFPATAPGPRRCERHACCMCPPMPCARRCGKIMSWFCACSPRSPDGCRP